MRLSRFFLSLIVGLLVVMPWTERFCNWDHFMRGGQDLELSMLATLVVLCLVLLLFQQGRALLASLLSLFSWVAALFRKVSPGTSSLARCRSRRHLLPTGEAGAYISPLRI